MAKVKYYAKVATRAAVRLAGSWRDKGRCKMEDVRGLMYVGSLNTNYTN